MSLSRRQFINKSMKASALGSLAVSSGIPGLWLQEQPLQPAKLFPVEPVYAANSVNAAIFRNALASTDKFQHAAYWDGDGMLKVARRTLNSSEWHIKKMGYQGNVEDAHNIVSIGVSPDGRTHLSFDHHNHPLRYRMENEPGSLEFSDDRPMTGKRESSVTYPAFIATPDERFFFFYRDGASGKGDILVNEYDPDKSTWHTLHHPLIDGEGNYNAYLWRPGVGPDGSLHLAWCWRRTWEAETNQHVCYGVSRDGGRSWERSDGTPYRLPITFDQAEIIDPVGEGSNLINQCSGFVDAQGQPHFAHYRNDEQGIPQFYHFYLNKSGAWQKSRVTERKDSFTLGGGGTLRIPISRPEIVVNRRGTAFVIYRDETRGGKVRLARSGGPDYSNWTHHDITDFEVGMWEPNYDPVIMRDHDRLELWVHNCEQGMHETTIPLEPQMAYVLSLDLG